MPISARLSLRRLQQVGIPILFEYPADLMIKMVMWLPISSGLSTETG